MTDDGWILDCSWNDDGKWNQHSWERVIGWDVKTKKIESEWVVKISHKDGTYFVHKRKLVL